MLGVYLRTYLQLYLFPPSVFENISSRYSQRDKKAGLPIEVGGNPAKTMHDNFFLYVLPIRDGQFLPARRRRLPACDQPGAIY